MIHPDAPAVRQHIARTRVRRRQQQAGNANVLIAGNGEWFGSGIWQRQLRNAGKIGLAYRRKSSHSKSLCPKILCSKMLCPKTRRRM
jgi:hypothetical protein